MFALKKVIGYFLMPLPASLVLLAAGVALLFLGARRAGRALAAAAALILVLASNQRVSMDLLRPLESRYPAADAAEISGCDLVVVLGGGNSDNPELPPTSQLSTSALARIVEAVRILRLDPKARLVVSGPGPVGRPTHADILAAAAASLGIDPARIEKITTARDTEDESHAVAALAAGRKAALVTSAWHMPRAAHLFRKAGVDIVPCPADFVARSDASSPGALVWNSESLERSTLAVHEWLGLLWLRLRGA